MGNRITQHHIALFRYIFSGRTDIYGTYSLQTLRSWQVKAPVTNTVIYNHLTGVQPYGVYLLIKDKTKAVVADFDTGDDLNPVIAYCRAAQWYGLPVSVEASKSKGFHCWTWFARPIPAWKARAVVRHILTETDHPNTEIFPRHDRLRGDASGNFLNSPLFGALVQKQRTVFLNLEKGRSPFVDQWAFLESVTKATEGQLDNIIDTNDLKQAQPQLPLPTTKSNTSKYGLLPCAQTILTNGVQMNQRIAAFRLAVHLQRQGLPKEAIADLLLAWRKRNKPKGKKQIITETEIHGQIKSACTGNYGLGCNDLMAYCDPRCPVFRKIHQQNGKEVLSWHRRKESQK